MSDLYDTDILLWSERQAELLRRLAAGEHVSEPVDWANVAEEMEALRRSQSRELASRLQTVLEHLIKLEVSPALEPRAGGRGTIRRERNEIALLLEDAPSLRQQLAAAIARRMDSARRAVLDDLADRGEQAQVDPAGLSYTADQVLGSWFP